MLKVKGDKKLSEIYISTDVEVDGPIPGAYSMLSIGSVALSPQGKVLGKFYRKLKPLSGAKKHPKVMEFWKENPKAYKEATSNSEDPEVVMADYIRWLDQISSSQRAIPIFLGWPLTLDYLFAYWYMVKFVKKFQRMHPFEIHFSFNKAIDVTSFIMAHLRKPYLEARMPQAQKKWRGDLFKRISHNPLEEAMIQGQIFIKILKENQKKK